MAQESKLKRKKKKWVGIVSDKPFENVSLGESYVSDAEKLKGKHISLNLMTLLSNPKKQAINVRFKIKELRENKGIAFLDKYQMTPSAVKRLVRRSRDKVDDSFLVKTKDGSVLRVKPLVVTNGNTYKSEQTRLRLKTRELLKAYVSKTTFTDFTKELIDLKVQKYLRDQLNKLYPIKFAEVRSVQLIERS